MQRANMDGRIDTRNSAKEKRGNTEVKNTKEPKEPKDKSKQQTLESAMKKMVTFADGSKKSPKGKMDTERDKVIEEFKTRVTEEVRKIRAEKLELEKVRLDIDAKIMEMNERVESLERKFVEFEERQKEWEQRASAAGSLASEAVGGDTGSVWSLRSGVSGMSMRSAISFSDREMAKMKRMVNEKDRSDRKNNIVIRGVEPEMERLKEWVEEFAEDRLGVKVKVEYARISGKVVVAKIEGEGKNEIMMNKNKLRGTKIYIENDLNIEDRKKQEEIHRWVKEKKEEGWNVRAGTGRVFFKGIWRKWEEREEIEKDMENMQTKETKGGEEGEQEKEKQNFK